MSDREFENYLTLIGRLLRLSSAQREAIGEELRDHFESRLMELTNGGMSHAEAVRIALEEFGDAAGLAAHFSRIAQTRKRRIIMRCTLASVVGLAAAVLVALALWPDNHAPKMIDRAAAQSPDKPQPAGVSKDLDKMVKVAETLPDDRDARMQAVLNEFTAVEFQGTPLPEAIDFLATKHHFQATFDTAALKEAGLEAPTLQSNLVLRDIHLKTALEFLLGQFNLSYAIRDGIFIVTTKDKADTTLVNRVYDCRPIFDAVDPYPHPTSSVVAKGESSATGPKASSAADSEKKPTATANNDVDNLIDVITSSVAPNSWNRQGGPGSILYYKGLLIISQTCTVHEDIAALLDKISSETARSAKPAN